MLNRTHACHVSRTGGMQVAYNEGTVLVRCPGCEALHLVADHMDWFKLGKVSLDDVLSSRGEQVVTDGNVFDLSPADLAVLAKEANSEGPGPRGTPMPREPPSDDEA